METSISIFSNYIDWGPNSFDMNLFPFNHNKPLFPHHVLATPKVDTIVNLNPIFATDKGFYIKNDTIISNVPIKSSDEEEYYSIKLRLTGWNRFYYTYKETRNSFTYIIYTKLGFEKLRQYVYEATGYAGEEVFDENVVGAMTICFSSVFDKTDDACTTILLSKTILPQKLTYNIEERSWSRDTLNISSLKNLLTRGFALSLVHDILKQTKYNISSDQDIDFSKLGDWEGYMERECERLGFDIVYSEKSIAKKAYDNLFFRICSEKDHSDQFETFIKDSFESFSNDLKDICAYLYNKDFKYTALTNTLSCRYRDDKLIAFVNIMISTQKRGVTDGLNPFAISEKEAKEYTNLLVTVVNDIVGIKNKLSWLDGNDMLTMSYISGMLLLNTDLHPNAAKSALSIWAYYMLYKVMINCPEEDKDLYSTLIYHIIGTNGQTFAKLMDIIKSTSISYIGPTTRAINTSWARYDSNYCVGELIYYFSNSFNTYFDTLPNKQRNYIGKGCNTNADYFSTYKETVSFTVAHTYRGMQSERKAYAQELFEYINNMLHRPDYTNKLIMDIIN